MSWSAFAITGGGDGRGRYGREPAHPEAGPGLVPCSAPARWLVPYPVFIVVGITYYLVIATVLYRALDRHDIMAAVWAAVVIAADEGWNAVFFGLWRTN